MKKKLRVSVGIPTYEGGESLQTALTSIYQQSALAQIVEVIVIVDGKQLSPELLAQVAHPKLKVISKKTRQGQSARITDLCQLATGDLLVLTNDDVILDTRAVEQLLTSHAQTQADLLSGEAAPLPARCLLEKILTVGTELNRAYLGFAGAHTYLSCNGRLVALSKRFYQTLNIPARIWNNDAYMYLRCVTTGAVYEHVADAIVWFRSPSVVREYFKQTWKFQRSMTENQAYFSQNISSEYHISGKKLLSAFWTVWSRKPVLASIYLGLHLLSRVIPYQSFDSNRGFWETDHSTKQIAL